MQLLHRNLAPEKTKITILSKVLKLKSQIEGQLGTLICYLSTTAGAPALFDDAMAF